MNSFAHCRALVMGLGRFGGGVGVTRWLASQGASVTVTDQAPAESLTESIEAVADVGATLHLGGHDLADLDHTDLVIVNPAVVKSKSPYFQEVLRRGLPWTTEMNLFCQRCPAPVIAVTGSFGKSTTCAMLAAAIREESRIANRPAPAGGRSLPSASAIAPPWTGVHLGGNIGHSLLMELPDIRPTDVVVLEMSNAQLEDLPYIDWLPDLAVVTNLWPHHLDRYHSFGEYVAAKLNIVGCHASARGEHASLAQPAPALTGLRKPRTVIVGDLYPEAELLLRQRLALSPEFDPDSPGQRRLLRVARPNKPIAVRIPGRHNQDNAACVLTVCQALGIENSAALAALAEFPGLPHRIEFLQTLDGVDFFNDSKSTSPSATMVAVESFERPVVAIIGGQKKDVPLAALAEVLARHCRAVICAGECGHAFADAVRSAAASADGLRPVRTLVHRVERLEEAVALARREARTGDVVLFSPGAPSFDRFVNFTQRGDHFTALVKALSSEGSR